MSFHGFVQAGGGSRRFGSDKALARLGRKTLLERTCELLEQVCSDVHIVASPAKYAGAPWPVLEDRWPGEGPLGGILTVLQHLRQPPPVRHSNKEEDIRSFAIILSCDMPFMTAEFVSFLKERALASEAQVVVPERDGRLEPLCASWRATSLESVQSYFEAGNRKVSEAMKRLPMEVLDESAWKRFDTDGHLFWNMNTPEDYEGARKFFEQRAEHAG